MVIINEIFKFSLTKINMKNEMFEDNLFSKKMQKLVIASHPINQLFSNAFFLLIDKTNGF